MKNLVLLLALLTFSGSARGATYYVSYSSGSNANAGTSQGSPWKSVPGMQTGAGCGGATHATTINPGDVVIFKGGDTWPAACFEWFAAGGSSGNPVYYGVCLSTDSASPCSGGTSWPSSGWTRPLFDMNYTVASNYHVVGMSSGTGYATFDNFEIAHQLVIGTNGYQGVGYAFMLSSVVANTVTVLNSWAHDWAMPPSVNFSDATYGDWGTGCIAGGTTSSPYHANMKNSTCSDANGYFYVGATKVSGVPFDGGCEQCYEVSGSTFHDTFAGCWSDLLCHDSTFYNISASANSYCNATNSGCHSQVIENDAGAIGQVVYNNLIYNNTAAVIYFGCAGDSFFNNVLYGNAAAGGDPPIMMDSRCGSTSSTVSKLYNNTCDGGGGYCFRAFPGGTFGQLNAQNNLWINNAGTGMCINGVGCSSANVTGTQSNNYVMSSSEASSHGYTSANKYAPTSSDTNAIGAGVNLSSLCVGSLAPLASDTRGAPWFGGSYQPRPGGSTAWDLGAYAGAGGGGGAGPPSISISAPSPGSVSGTISLTAGCTAGSGTTVSSIQFTIDGNNFGVAGTSSPYTLSWNTLTAANASHVIGAKCTQSDAQTANASTVTVTVSNSMPGCFVSTDNDSGALSWTANQAFTAQSSSFTATFTAKPNTANQDTVVALSQSAMSAYSQGAMLLRFNSSGQIDVYKGSLGNYTSDTAVNYTAGTTYAFTLTVNMASGNYTVALTNPSALTIASGYSFRTTAPAGNLGYVNAVGDDTTPDTVEVCAMRIGNVSLLPATESFGTVNVGLSSSPMTFTVSNTSSSAATSVSPTTIGGNAADFAVTNSGPGSCGSLGGSIVTGASCTFVVTFSPAATGSRSTTLSVPYSGGDGASPQSSALSGTGTNATAPAPPTHLQATVE